MLVLLIETKNESLLLYTVDVVKVVRVPIVEYYFRLL